MQKPMIAGAACTAMGGFQGVFGAGFGGEPNHACVGDTNFALVEKLLMAPFSENGAPALGFLRVDQGTYPPASLTRALVTQGLMPRRIAPLTLSTGTGDMTNQTDKHPRSKCHNRLSASSW